MNGTFGAAAATHWAPASVAMAVLERGGNAFDAAAAAGFVLQVVEPHFNGPGGEVPIMLYSADTRSVEVIGGQGPMPMAASIDHFRDLGLNHIPGSGLLPACVPGAVGAWLRLLAEFGTMPLGDILQYAIAYARDGHHLLPQAALAISTLGPLFATEWPESGATYLPGGTAPQAGSLFRNPALADMYERLVKEATATPGDREAQIEGAHRAFYQGFVAEAIDAFAATEMLDSTGRRNRGFLSGQDMASWRPSRETPTSLSYRDFTVHKPGPWSQGPVFLQQLSLLSGFDLAGMGQDSAEYVHTVIESAKLAFADREAWYGDPDQTDIPLTDLLSESYAAGRRSEIGHRAASLVEAGAPGGRTARLVDIPPDEIRAADTNWMHQIANGLPTIVAATVARADTCTVMVADRWGNLVSAVPSGGWLKSSSVVPGLGFPLGTRGQTMWLQEGHPNSLAPGRRPRTTLSPTLVTRADDPFLAFGTPGGDRQDQWTLEFFLSVAEFGSEVQEATEGVAFHTDDFSASFTPREARPGVLVIERDADPEVVDELRRRGHEVELVPEQSLGKVCAVGFDPVNGGLRAGASPRGRQAHAVCR